jgi:hypothetical protein
MKERAKLRGGDPVILLPSGTETTVRIAGKNTFTVRCRATPLLVRDEYHPTENPSGTWCRPKCKPEFDIRTVNDIVDERVTEEEE